MGYVNPQALPGDTAYEAVTGGRAFPGAHKPTDGRCQCRGCRGTGKRWKKNRATGGSFEVECWFCGGSGENAVAENFHSAKACPACDGTGLDAYGEECGDCRGTARAW